MLMPFWTTPKVKMTVLFLIAMVATWLIYQPILSIARKLNVTDRPNERKLQGVPVPLLGGAAVFFGIVFSLCYFKTTINHTTLFPVLGIMVVMLYLGIIDDLLDLSPRLRLGVEAVASLLLIYGVRYCISSFQGLFGIEFMPAVLGVPLAVIAFIGIVNSVNMIDGVDGLLSTFSIFACGILGLMSFLLHDYSFAALAAVSAGAMTPFLLHNLFGEKTKMYLGDGGSMMIGTVISSLVISLLRKGAVEPLDLFLSEDLSLISFCLATLSIPVFDTLRLIFFRLRRGESPFHPDRNHLHHILMDLGFPAFGIVSRIILLDLTVVLLWLASFLLGAGVNIQFLVVLAGGLAVTTGLAFMVHHSAAFRAYLEKCAGRAQHRDHSSFRQRLRRMMDKRNVD